MSELLGNDAHWDPIGQHECRGPVPEGVRCDVAKAMRAEESRKGMGDAAPPHPSAASRGEEHGLTRTAARRCDKGLP